MYSEVIYLVELKETVDEVGEKRIIETNRKELIADMKSVKRTEFYESMANGLKPELIFNIAHFRDYNKEKYLEHDGIRYKILRTFKLDNYSLDITVYDGIHVSEVLNGTTE